MKSTKLICCLAIIFFISHVTVSAAATTINYDQAIVFHKTELDCAKQNEKSDFFQTERKRVLGEFSNVSADNTLHITVVGYEFAPNFQLRKHVYVDRELKPGEVILKEWIMRSNTRIYIEIQSSDIEKLPPSVKGKQGYAWLYEKSS